MVRYHKILAGSFTVGRKSETMGTFDPENEIGNQIWARCCGRVAQTEPQIAQKHTKYPLHTH